MIVQVNFFFSLFSVLLFSFVSHVFYASFSLKTSDNQNFSNISMSIKKEHWLETH